jgi:oligopeptide transport system substrate-binding protein
MPKLRWWTLLSVLVIAFVALAAACGDDDDDDGGDDGGDATPTTAGGDNGFDESKMGGEVTIQALEFQSFDPHFSSFSQDLMHLKQVFRGLYKLDIENNPIPEMADGAPSISEDGKTYTITLKDGIVWSDGTPITAADFVLGIQRTCNYVNAGGYQYVISNIVGCDDYYDAANADKTEAEVEALREAVGATAIDDKTFEITLNSAQPTFTLILTMWPTWPIPSHVFSDPGGEWPAPTDLVFNGPFKVESYAAGESMVFVRNEDYKGGHLAYLDKVTFRYIEDTATANNAYRNGEVLMALADTTNFEGLKTEFPEELFSQVSAVTIGLQMQMEVPPLDNKDVRLALSRAIDRDTLNSVVLQNANFPTTTWVPADVAGIAQDTFDDTVGFNPEEAKKHLEAAGYPNGEGFPELGILIRDTPGNKATAEFLQSQFKEILNINVTVEIVDAPTRSQRFTDEDFELFPGGWGQDYPDPENWIVGLFDTGGGLNHYNCSMPEIDSLIEAAKFNPNNEERKEQYRQVNALIVENACGIAPMYHRANNYLISAELGGAREFSTSNDFVLAADWISEEWYLKK